MEGIWSRKGTILRPSQYRPARLKDSIPSKTAQIKPIYRCDLTWSMIAAFRPV